ncbi:HEAT repeat domain-containing protein [Microcoleus sp. FACHB-1515]|uniref:phycobilisome degradation protein NblB n=1 Tax=Cyanophyceae TaxID=3028117 RepID=UPI001688143D|nr:HEAT repeat domain-containing protein [Microcoleus sp. FACHB-1515]MBD2090778.1 HEAT repeat domain-containing protein [Microcoleus sp. FACHB-1515]
MSITPDSVKELLQSEDFGQRLSAVNQIRQLEDPAAAFELANAATSDRSARVRYAAVSQLSSLGQQNREAALVTLRRCLLEDSEPDVQAAAADSIGALKMTAAFDDLKHLYESTSEWLVQFSIIAALGELGDPRSFELLQSALNSDIELVKTAAIGSLGELGDDRAVPLLAPFATNSDWQIRYRVVQALSRINNSQARELLQTLANDSVESVAQEAKQNL